MSVREYVGARYVPLFATPLQWSNTITYEPLTIVINNGNSYTSRQFVPVGIDIENESYWALTGNYNAQIEQYRQEVALLAESVSKKPVIFNTLSDVVGVSGGYVQTLGGSAVNDGGGCLYKVSQTVSDFTIETNNINLLPIFSNSINMKALNITLGDAIGKYSSLGKPFDLANGEYSLADVKESVPVALYNGTINVESTLNGSAVFSGGLSLQNVEINTSGNQEIEEMTGGIFINGGYLNILNCSGTLGGGMGVLVYKADSVTIEDCNFSNPFGYAFYLNSMAFLKIENVHVKANASTNRGWHLFDIRNDFTGDNVVKINNVYIDGYVGNIIHISNSYTNNWDYKEIVIENINVYALEGGNAIKIVNSETDLNISNSVLVSNTHTLTNYAIFAQYEPGYTGNAMLDCNVSNTTISGFYNVADIQSGGTMRLFNCIISGISSINIGSLEKSESPSMIIKDCVFNTNYIDIRGGSTPAYNELTIENNQFNLNNANIRFPLDTRKAKSLVMRNNNFVGTSAVNYVGLYADTVVFQNNMLDLSNITTNYYFTLNSTTAFWGGNVLNDNECVSSTTPTNLYYLKPVSAWG